MPKSTEVPNELRDFNKVFERIAYRHGWGEVYHDFIDYLAACFLWNGDKELAARLEKKYKKEYPYFNELFVEWIKVHEKMLAVREWYDGLGSFYEVVASSHKASALGQFFTPPDVVDMMTVLNSPVEKGGKKRMNDPCSGSGRMLISFHAHFPGNYCFAADIDPICAKMTAINMALHGCEGQAVCMDSLLPDDWRFGYEINPYIHKTGGIPHLVRIQKEQCLQWRGFQEDKARFAAQKAKAVEEAKTAKVTVKEEPSVGKFGQLSFL
ncbi:MAG: N-6 DNA methylase [Runella zeae]